MKKIYKIEDLDCAHCAAKIEQAISELDGVENAAVSFLSQKITLEVNEDKINEIDQEIFKYPEEKAELTEILNKL